jgi:hypothetical protein
VRIAALTGVQQAERKVVKRPQTITRPMRKFLTGELGYQPEEIDDLDIEIAQTVVSQSTYP